MIDLDAELLHLSFEALLAGVLSAGHTLKNSGQLSERISLRSNAHQAVRIKVAASTAAAAAVTQLTCST